MLHASFLLVALHLCYLFDVALSYGAGAPEDACVSMTPNHGVDPQKSAAPYQLLLSSNDVLSGGSVTVTIKGTKGNSFKGFLLQARDSAENPIGTFQDITSNSKTINCGGQQTTATHLSPDDKSEVQVYWNAPANHQGKVTFKATVAQDGEVFWVGQVAKPITVQGQ